MLIRARNGVLADHALRPGPDALMADVRKGWVTRARYQPDDEPAASGNADPGRDPEVAGGRE